MVGKKKELFIWRSIAIFGTVLLLVKIITCFIYNNFTSGSTPNPKDFFPVQTIFAINVLGFFIFIFLIFKPLKLELYGLFSFLYAIPFLVDGYCPFIGVLMILLSITTLYVRGFYNNHTKIKFILTGLITLGLMLSGIKYGFELWIDGFLNSLSRTLIIGIITYLILNKVAKDKKYSGKPVLDLSKFPELTDRDKEWIKKLLTETKYTTIASQYEISEGAVKNRMRFIFKILNVPDRIGFMASFSGYEVLY